ncbi:MAG: 30S ribosomal protein S5 [Caldisericia bacterium]|nr:30S ribosomal protein S5 [Caldisericia bacterium]
MRNDSRPVRNEDLTEDTETFEEEIVHINRVSKTVKGGKRMKFRILMVVGNRQGKVGIGIGKSDQIPNGIRKAVNSAQREMIEFPLRKGTLPHDVIGKQGSAKVYLFPAVPGTGIIAGGSVRKILEKAGITDVVAKIIGSHNAVNTARATIDALNQLKDPVVVAKQRGISMKQLFGL